MGVFEGQMYGHGWFISGHGCFTGVFSGTRVFSGHGCLRHLSKFLLSLDDVGVC